MWSLVVVCEILFPDQGLNCIGSSEAQPLDHQRSSLARDLDWTECQPIPLILCIKETAVLPQGDCPQTRVLLRGKGKKPGTCCRAGPWVGITHSPNLSPSGRGLLRPQSGKELIRSCIHQASSPLCVLSQWILTDTWGECICYLLSCNKMPPVSCCCCSVPKLYLTLCDPMDCGISGLLILHYFLEFAQIHVHWVSDAIQPSYPLSHLLLLPSIFPSIRVFSDESALRNRWPKYWTFSFSISPSENI